MKYYIKTYAIGLLVITLLLQPLLIAKLLGLGMNNPGDVLISYLSACCVEVAALVCITIPFIIGTHINQLKDG